MERGFKYRIYPNESQRDQIARTFGCCRFVYNRALDVKKTAYSETGKSIATNDLIKMIPAWKRDPDTSWLAQVDSMIERLLLIMPVGDVQRGPIVGKLVFWINRPAPVFGNNGWSSLTFLIRVRPSRYSRYIYLM